MSLISIPRRPSQLASPFVSDGKNNHSFSENVHASKTAPLITTSANADEFAADSVFTFNTTDERGVRYLDSLVQEAVAEDLDDVEASHGASDVSSKQFSLDNETSTSSANYYTIKGAAVFLNSQLSNSTARPKTPVVKHDDSFFPSTPKSPHSHHALSCCDSPPASPVPGEVSSSAQQQQAAEISRHLELMLERLRDEDQIMMAAKLESNSANRARYLTLICCSQPSEGDDSLNCEMVSALLGFDVALGEQEDDKERATLGLAILVDPDLKIRLTGDGGFNAVVGDRSYSFKPVAVQVMWACLHAIMEATAQARRNIRYSTGVSSLASAWLSSYSERIDSDPVAVSDWQIMDEILSRLPPADSESAIELEIRDQLRTLMSSIDLEEVSCRTIRLSLESEMQRDLSAYRQFIDEEMLVLLGQLDLPSKIYDFLYLGSEWNASDIGVLTRLGITHVVNVSREIDNFFPSHFEYFNVRVYDDESAELLRYWNSVYKFIEAARQAQGRILVHCKMGVSRSAACVMAYCMKAHRQSRDEAIDYVRSRRECVQPNKGFMEQLRVYQGILKASSVRYSDLFRRVDEMVNDAQAAQRPVSFPDGSAPSLTSEALFLSYPVNNLGSRIAAFETTDGKKHHDREAHLQERRLRNRTSPAMPSSLPAMASDARLRMNCRSKEDVSSTDGAEASLPESGHVRRVTAQLMMPNGKSLQDGNISLSTEECYHRGSAES